MTTALVLKLAFVAVAGWCATHQQRDLSAFDMRRCYALHQQLHCWPKRGVLMAGDGALAWQVATVKPQRRFR
jgi:hypothetical protein